MYTATVSFEQRLRLMQLVGGFQAIGLPAQRATNRLLDKVELSGEAAAEIGFEFNPAADELKWDKNKLQALKDRPEGLSYTFDLDKSEQQLLKSIIHQSPLRPFYDRWLEKFVDDFPDVPVEV